ncbi:SH3 domain-containing protein [Niallia sp. XMNu-256]|uniref:SH3 domain-containing protein n=1 Tax=Niallia sp. XMNu-256 TaxID=3082444 RepID=UPI0030CAC0E5
MKKLILPGLCLAVLSTPAFERVVQAEEKVSSVTVSNMIQYVNVDSGRLNMRASASTNATILAKLTNGTEVNVQSISNGWAKIRVNGKTGYVSTSYITEIKPSHSSKTTAPAPKRVEATTKYVNVSRDTNLNLRASATTSSSVVAKLPSGTQVTVYSEHYGWSKVAANGKEGYASTNYLANTKVQGAEEKQTAQAPKSNPPVSIKYVDVGVGTNLNVRNSPSTTSKVLTKLKHGTEVKVLSDQHGWAKIEAAGTQGYVSSLYLSSNSKTTTTKQSKPSTPAQTITTQYVDVNENIHLNMRSGASTSTSVVAKLKAGTPVEVYSVSNGWSKVKASGKEGYVSAEYLTKGKTGTSTPPPTAPKPSSTTQYVDVNENIHLNMRSGASTSTSVVAKLKAGTAVEVYSVSNGWAKVKASGKEGYVSAEYLTKGKTGTSTPPPTAPKPSSTTQYVDVNENIHLNMRSGASTNTSVVAKLKAGTAVEVYSVSNGWAKVKASGKEGYVSAEYLTKGKTGTSTPPATAPKPSSTIQYVDVNENIHLNMRSGASTSTSVVAKLKAGTAVEVYSVSNGWAKVKASGKEGYVSAEYLTKTNPKPEEVPNKPAQDIVKYVDVDQGVNLNMRNRPTTNASVMVKLARGIEVKVLSEENGWTKIIAYGQEGYVSSEYLSNAKPGSTKETEAPTTNSPTDQNSTNQEGFEADPIAPNHSEPTSEPDLTVPNESESGSEVEVGDETQEETDTTSIQYVDVPSGWNLNLREGPSTSTNILTKLVAGTAVTVLSVENGWARVTANGKTGYVGTQYLTSKPANLPSQNVNKVYTEYDLTLEESTNIQMKANPQTDQNYAVYIREDALNVNSLTNPTSGVVEGSGWRVRGGAGTEFWIVGKINNGEKVNIKSVSTGNDGYKWYEITYNRSWVNASPEDVAHYLDPNNFTDNPVTSFQFLKLSESTSLDQFEVNERILAGKGILEGHAASFIAASERYGVNDMYLISHALLETGNGSSQLANGVEINGKKVYNMFGIGAYDGSAVESGAKFAYEQGWFSPVEAIIGGARFISSSYIGKGQDTIYKMRWNPEAAASTGVATHQYATDIRWATKQVKQIHNLYSLIDSYNITLEIPLYKRF